MKKKKVLVWLCVFFLASASAFGGDIATFVNLGFDREGEHFMFGLYGIDNTRNIPYAEGYIVDVDKNVYARNGVLKKEFDIPVTAGFEGLGGLITLIEDNVDLIKGYSINHLHTGRLVYVLLNGEKPKKSLKFRDFTGGKSYSVELVQKAEGKGEELRSAFHIELSVVDKDNTLQTYTVGHPQYWREQVSGYRIRQIILGPNEEGVVFILEKEIKSPAGDGIRYMVETVSLK